MSAMRWAAGLLVLGIWWLTAIPVAAQENFILKMGKDKIFEEYNYFDYWTEDYGQAPLPPAEDLVAQQAGSQASVSVRATPGHEGGLRANFGVLFQWDLDGWPWNQVNTRFMRLTIDFSYTLECYWEPFSGSAHSAITYPFNPQGPWLHLLGDDEPPGLNQVPETRRSVQYIMQVQQLENFGRRIYLHLYAHGHSATSGPWSTNHGLTHVTIHSIRVEFLGRHDLTPVYDLLLE